MKRYLSLVKFAHTIFALPFALLGYVIALETPGHKFQWEILLLVILCMVFARSAAMAFNRYVDRHIDQQNARTRYREIPSGKISPRAALTFVVINSVLFILCAWLINPLCFALSPVALAVILGYSYTKKFTAMSHFILGLGLAMAPVGAYLAVTAQFGLTPVLLGMMVLLWVGGFDIIYALQDAEFDRQNRLQSIPAIVGKARALRFSLLAHLACAILCLYTVLLLTMQFSNLSWILWSGAAAFLGLLVYQHLIVKPHDLSRVNLAFFTTNGIASLLFGVLAILDFYV